MVTGDGRVKVLDFGVAKRVALPDGATADLGLLTMPGSVTVLPGICLPRRPGEIVDFRSDHFSFGAVLYEMATGRRAFRGKSAIDVQAAILLEQPESLTRLNAEMPAPLVWFV
jgi:serine/threonine protein kinase